MKIRSVWKNMKAQSEFWDVLYMITTFHENTNWVDAKTDKLVMQAKQPISCAKVKFRPKNSNLEHESTIWNFHVISWRNMFQSKLDVIHEFCMKMYEFNLELVSRSHGNSMNEKFWSSEKICFELRKKVEVSEKF